jgi:hypothetical protein
MYPRVEEVLGIKRRESNEVKKEGMPKEPENRCVVLAVFCWVG